MRKYATKRFRIGRNNSFKVILSYKTNNSSKFENIKSLLFTSFFSKVDTFVSNCLPIIPSLINKLDEA